MKMRSIQIAVVIALLILNACSKDETHEEEKVVKQDPELTWENPKDIYYGTSLSEIQLNATANMDGVFTYNPPLKTKLKVGENQQLEVSFDPDNTYLYNSISKKVYINVKAKKVPVITWDNPNNIYWRTALTNKQLNASSNIEGTFTYSPDLGEIVYAGKDINLTTIFTPNDTVEYSIVKDTVKIDVDIQDIEFNNSVSYGTMTDQDGNVYKTVTIGEQTWMAENLRTTTYRNGDPITKIEEFEDWKATTKGAYCWMKNDEETHKNKFGAFYNWHAVTDSRNIAPEGWHVATVNDWDLLLSTLGGNNVAGGKLKESGNKHWAGPNKGANNSSGFSALPTGSRSTYGSLVEFQEAAYSVRFWSNRDWNEKEAYVRYMSYEKENVEVKKDDKNSGNAVRLVKD
jgi:uncharacterized protein (TIGR02145 family)